VSAASENPGTLRNGVLHMFIDERALSAADERTDHRLRIARITNLVGLGARGKLLTELVKNRGLDNDARIAMQTWPWWK